MANETNRKFETQEVIKNNHKYRQIIEDGKIVGEEDLGEIKPMKPNTAPATAEPATEATAPASSTTESVKPAEPEQKKGLSAKVKKGLAIGGGIAGGLAAYALGVKKGRSDGEADGYTEGYQAGVDSVSYKADENVSDWEAQE